MPSNMQRLSKCLSTILSCMECPVCLDTIPPPASQCINGHLICSKCHTKSERCPVCRIRLSRGRSLFADQVYNSVTDAFELAKESDEKVRTAKINEIFRLRKSKKHKNNPEIKVTQSHTNKFLERFVEKSSSAENLAQQYLTPKTLLNEFNSSLRTKSLSTSEIFNPGVSPRAVFRDGSKSSLMSRMQCGRSFESLDGNICMNHSNSISTCQTDESLYHCPFSIGCVERMKEEMITQHFQETHDGPLIQYFKCKMTFTLQNAHNDTYCILHNTEHFFLKLDVSDENNTNSTDDFHGIVIWMWMLGTQNVADEYHLKINLYYSSCPEKQLLSLNSSVYSLSTTSWKNIKTMQKGVFISNTTLNALNFKSNDIMLDVEIKHHVY